MKKEILGVKVDLVNRREAVQIIAKEIKEDKLFFVVTAYSEFFVAAQRDHDFKKIINNAGLVVPDGVGPLAAIDYEESIKPTDRLVWRLLQGLSTGFKIMRGKVGEPVPGVWLFSELVKKAAENKWKIFLLGGFGDEVTKLENSLIKKYPNLRVQADSGEQRLGKSKVEEEREIKKINLFEPDILFVAYGQIKQEKWIYKNRNKIKTSVAMGVGSTFDELTGKIKIAPRFVEKTGLKWLWRLIQEPKRFRRIINAFPVFPWLIYRETFKHVA